MLEFFVLVLILIVAYYVVPMIIGLVIILLCIAVIAIPIVILLARFGLLPGFRYVRYVGDTRKNKSSWKWKWKYPGRGDRNERGNHARRSEGNRDSGGWYRTSQEGEEITLPETALRKENDAK